MKIAYEEIFDEYSKLIFEKLDITLNYGLEYLFSLNKLSKDTINKYRDVFNNYFRLYNQYKYIINFILLHRGKINYDDAVGALDMLNEKFEEIIPCLYNLLDDYRFAYQLRKDFKFNPSIKLSDIDFNDIFNYVKGFNIDNISNFLVLNNVYSSDMFDNIYDNVKVINCDKEDYYVFSGINDDGDVMVPYIKDEESTLINIHELVHKSLLLNKDSIDNNYIVYSEVLPIFYEMLYKKDNKFCKSKIHDNELANKLYKDNKGEPLDIQINKLKKMI